MSGTTVDANIALNANGPKPINPLAQAGQFAQTMGGLTSLQNSRLQLAGRNALAQAYQNAPIDPVTGLPDQKALISALQSTPGGGLVLPDVIKSNQAQQIAGYQINQAQLAQAQNRAAAVGSLTAPLLSKIAAGQPVGLADVAGVLKQAHALGLPTDEATNSVAQTMPLPDPARMSDPAYMASYSKQAGAWAQNWTKTMWGASAPAAVQAQTFTPNLHPIDNGPNINMVNTNPMGGPVSSYGAIQKGNTPADLSQMVEVKGPDGKSVYMTHQQAMEKAGVGLNGAFTGAQPSPQAPGTPQPTAGTPSAPAVTPAPVSGAVTPLPGGGFSAGPSIQEAADLKNAADASIAQYNQAHAAVNGYAGRIVQLQQALHGLQNSPTGPGTDETNNIKSFLLAQDPGILKAIGLSPNEVTVANHDMANKYLTQYATNAATAFGGGTDQQLAATLTGNASTHISNLAAQDVVKTATALERMKAAQMQAFDQSGLQPHEFNKWSLGWQKNVDPRAFEFDLLTPDQRNALVKSLGPPGSKPYEAFAQKLLAAQKSGFITPPAQNAGP